MTVRIERLSIRDFGPLRDLVLSPADVTVVYGQNEAGKTSCIDALARALRERVRSGNRKLLENLRDGPGFAGEVELKLDPEDGGPLVDLLREHPSLARLFIVRDGDATLEGGRNWLNAIRGRLIGIDLGRVAERVRLTASLTPNGALREAKLDERQRIAERLTRVDAFLADLPTIGRVTEEISQLERQRNGSRVRAEKLRVAERFERYRVAREALATASAAGEAVRDLDRYGDQDLKDWREAVSAVRATAAVHKGAEAETQRLREQVELSTEEMRKKQIAAERAASLLAETGRRDLETLVTRARLVRQLARMWGLWRTPLAVAASLLLLLSVGLAFFALGPGDAARGVSLGLAAGAAAFAGLAGGALSIYATSRMRTAAALEEQALASCSVVLPRVNKLDECAAELAAIASRTERTEIERTGAVERKRAAEAALSVAEHAEAAAVRRLDEAQRLVSEVRDRVRLSSIDQLEDKLRERTRAASTHAQARSTLVSILGDGSDAELAQRIDTLIVPDPGIAANPAELIAVENELQEVDERLMSLRNELTDRRDRALAAIGLTDLGAADAERARLADSLETIDRETAAAKLCLQALRELAQDIDRPLREALGSAPGAAGAYLERLTSGRYRSVVLDTDGKLAVERSDGTRFGSDSLSRGARDQLALGVRLALVRRLLGEPAFLVLDDAFLSSDPSRREALSTAVSDLAGEGWQILYFTFDPALRDRLAGRGAKVVQLATPAGAVELD